MGEKSCCYVLSNTKMDVEEVGIFEFHDKMKLKKGYAKKGVRVVPHAIARYGSYLARGANYDAIIC